MAEEQEQPEVAPQEPLEIAETPAEEPAEQEEATDEQEVEVAEKEDVPEPETEAPSIVEQLLPSAAAAWGDLTVKQQQAIHDDLVQSVQTPGGGEGGAHIAEAGDPESPASNAAAGPVASPRSALNVTMPDGITAEEVAAVKEFVDDRPLVGSFFQKILNGHTASMEIGRTTVGWIEDFGESQELTEARTAYKRELAALKPKDAHAVLTTAKQMRREGRVSSLRDAVAVALHDRGRPTIKTERAPASVASSLARGGKGRGTVRPKKPKRFGSAGAAFRWNEENPQPK